VLVAVAARSLADIAEEVTLTQYRTSSCSRREDRRIWSDWPRPSGDAGHRDTNVRSSREEEVDRSSVGTGRSPPVRLALTKKGLKLVGTVTNRRRREIEAILSTIAPEEQSVLVQA